MHSCHHWLDAADPNNIAMQSHEFVCSVDSEPCSLKILCILCRDTKVGHIPAGQTKRKEKHAKVLDRSCAAVIHSNLFLTCRAHESAGNSGDVIVHVYIREKQLYLRNSISDLGQGLWARSWRGVWSFSSNEMAFQAIKGPVMIKEA